MLEGFFQPTHLPVLLTEVTRGRVFIWVVCVALDREQFLAFEAKQTLGRPRHLGHRQGQKLIFRRDLKR
jgi:hypothetical protein